MKSGVLFVVQPLQIKAMIILFSESITTTST